MGVGLLFSQAAAGFSHLPYNSPYPSYYFTSGERKRKEKFNGILRRGSSSIVEPRPPSKKRGSSLGLLSLFGLASTGNAAQEQDEEEPDDEDEAGEERFVYYPEGPMSDLVYPVNGGLEDWAYAGGLEGGKCLPRSQSPDPPTDEPERLPFLFLLCLSALRPRGWLCSLAN